jgi:hypothetical protein
MELKKIDPISLINHYEKILFDMKWLKSKIKISPKKHLMQFNSKGKTFRINKM